MVIKGVGIATFGDTTAGSGAIKSSSLTKNIASGSNTFAHGVSNTISFVEVKDASNYPVEFSDFHWDSTNLYVTVGSAVNNITFVIFYEA